MNYRRIYKQFIKDRRVKEPAKYRGLAYDGRTTRDSRHGYGDGGYYEHHHIKPRHAGGANDARNIISLTAADHYEMKMLEQERAALYKKCAPVIEARFTVLVIRFKLVNSQ